MKSQSRKPAAGTAKQHEPQSLGQPLSKRLLAYAAMAGAGVAAYASPAAAEIVYTPTRSNVHFEYPLDLNHDGIPDFRIFSSYLSGIFSLGVIPLINGNRIAGTHKGCLLFHSVNAAALGAGAEIGPSVSFQAQATCMAVGVSSLNYGPWVDAKNRYLGLALNIDGRIHFGWVRISVNPFFCFSCQARIEGYAYETIPGKAIRAGDEGGVEEACIAPGSLGMLALGAPGINLWRSEQP